MNRSLTVWAKVTKLNFKRVFSAKDADLTISFGKGSHGDPYAFDGQGWSLHQ